MDTKEIGNRLVELCKQGKNLEAVNTLYHGDVVSVEAQAGVDMPAEVRGLDAIRGKHHWWAENHEIHSAETQGPFVNGDRFAATFKYEITPKTGPRAGQRTTMEEVAVYTTKDGKVVHEAFFY
jgi:hypothetical protein